MSLRSAVQVLLVATVLLAAPVAGASAVSTTAAGPSTTAPSPSPSPVASANSTPDDVRDVEAADADAAALDPIDVSLDPADATADAGENATFDVVVDGASEEIFAFEVVVSTSDRDVAPIVDGEALGGGTSTDPTPEDDGRSISFRALGTDLGPGPATVARVTVTGEAAGTADLTLETVRIVDPSGNQYPVDERANATVTVEDTTTPTTVALDPATATLSPDGSRTIDVVATGVPDGVSTMDLTVSSGNASVAAFESGSIAGEPSIRQVRIPADGSSARLQAAGASITDDDGDGSVTLGTVTVAGNATGETDLSVAVSGLGTSSSRYEVTSTSGTTVVVDDSAPAVPPVVGDDPPTNVDSDPLLEDVDGDGTFTIFDVQAFLENFEGETVRSNAASFNFDGSADGEITIFDVQALLEEL
jgi:hypothetical protein